MKVNDILSENNHRATCTEVESGERRPDAMQGSQEGNVLLRPRECSELVEQHDTHAPAATACTGQSIDRRTQIVALAASLLQSMQCTHTCD